ncbi:MAG TPA: hypothetical protein VF510_07745, partial [Ktedonobacterales bacterium]
GTWLPDGGENAVILQPGFWDGPVASLARGPTLYERIASPDGSETFEEPREYAVALEPGEDPEVLDEDEFRQRGDWDRFMDYVEESKIGGTPAFLQYQEYPGPGRWQLLAQLNALIVPAGPNFGDAGYGYAFLSEDGRVAKFLWQS